MGNLIVAGNDLTPAVLNQYYGYADTTSTTVTAATATRLTTSYSIPASEPAAAESAYEILFGGSGTWGSTQQLIGFQLHLQAVSVVANVSIAATAFSASAGFRFAGRALLVCDSTGATGGFYGALDITLTQTANAVLPGTTADNTVAIADANAAAATIDTTSAMAAIVTAGWAGTTGAPTITNRHTVFRKVS